MQILWRRRCSRVVDLKLPIFLKAVMSEGPFEIEVSDEKKTFDLIDVIC